MNAFEEVLTSVIIFSWTSFPLFWSILKTSFLIIYIFLVLEEVLKTKKKYHDEAVRLYCLGSSGIWTSTSIKWQRARLYCWPNQVQSPKSENPNKRQQSFVWYQKIFQKGEEHLWESCERIRTANVFKEGRHNW